MLQGKNTAFTRLGKDIVKRLGVMAEVKIPTRTQSSGTQGEKSMLRSARKSQTSYTGKPKSKNLAQSYEEGTQVLRCFIRMNAYQALMKKEACLRDTAPNWGQAGLRVWLKGPQVE